MYLKEQFICAVIVITFISHCYRLQYVSLNLLSMILIYEFTSHYK